jgi:SLT domain-containing protein
MQGIEMALLGFTQIASAGTLNLQDLRQVALNLKLPLNMFAEELGIAESEIGDIGSKAIPAQKAMEAIVRTLEKRFAGGMKELSNSLLGMTSVIKDTASLTVWHFGKGMAEPVKRIFMDIIGMTEETGGTFEEFQRKLEEVGRRVGRKFEEMYGRAKRFFSDLTNTPGWNEMTWSEKVSLALDRILNEVNIWLEGPGGETIKKTGETLGVLLKTGMEKVIPEITPVALELGKTLGGAIVQGIYEAIKASPWAGILLGAYVGFQLGGPKGAAIGAGIGAATWGIPKGFEALGKHIPGSGYYTQERLAEHERAEQMFGERRAVTPEGEPLFPGTELRAMPKRAIGGIFSRPHTALVAEAGPEAIIPLTKPERAWSLWQQVGDRMGFFEREKVVYNIPTKLMQQRMTYNIPDSSIENIQTATITRKMSEPLDKLQKETRHIITRGQDAISKITSIFKRINTYQTRLATEVNYHYLGPTSYQPLVKATAAKFNIPAGILARLIQAESSWNPSAVSPAGAFGLTQVMPATARGMGYSVDALRRSPALQIEAGAKYLSQQYKRFGSWPLALAAYNAGPGAVSKYGGIPPYRETQNYVAKILSPVKYAFGGILTRPHMGLVAEAGPEAIIPLTSRMRSRALGLWEETGRRLGVRTPELALGGAGGSPISVTNYISVSVNSSNADPDEIAEAIAIKLERSYHNMPRN